MICPEALQVNTSICPGVSMNTYLRGPRGSCGAFEGGPWGSRRGVSGSGKWGTGQPDALLSKLVSLSHAADWFLRVYWCLRSTSGIHDELTRSIAQVTIRQYGAMLRCTRSKRARIVPTSGKYIRETCAPPAPTEPPQAMLVPEAQRCPKVLPKATNKLYSVPRKPS